MILPFTDGTIEKNKAITTEAAHEKNAQGHD
jgi:hypothetical protein